MSKEIILRDFAKSKIGHGGISNKNRPLYLIKISCTKGKWPTSRSALISQSEEQKIRTVKVVNLFFYGKTVIKESLTMN